MDGENDLPGLSTYLIDFFVTVYFSGSSYSPSFFSAFYNIGLLDESRTNGFSYVHESIYIGKKVIDLYIQDFCIVPIPSISD